MSVDPRGELRDELAAVFLPNQYELLFCLFDHAEQRSLDLELRNPVIPGVDASSLSGNLRLKKSLYLQ